MIQPQAVCRRRRAVRGYEDHERVIINTMQSTRRFYSSPSFLRCQGVARLSPRAVLIHFSRKNLA